MELRAEVRNAEALGHLLQQARLLQGKSQRDLAEELGVGQKWIWEMEKGKPGLFTERLFHMLRATGCRLYLEIEHHNDDNGKSAERSLDQAHAKGTDVVNRATKAKDRRDG